MAWPGKPGEQVQDDWQARSAKKREELSRSIEETLADEALIDDSLSGEEDEAFQESKNSLIIAPKLSLQSKQMPAVRVEPQDATSASTSTTTDPVAVPATTQKKRRLAGRSTKVHLQAVPKKEKKPLGKIAVEEEKSSIGFDTEGHIEGKSNSKRHVSPEKGAVSKSKMDKVATATLAGSGFVHRGQRDVMITNSHVTSSSIVLITLVEDPGPVVVKYTSLHPQLGFTLHFSDSAEFDARFNYVILLGELF